MTERSASRSEEEPVAAASIFLTGFMGSGKTTVGAALAERLGLKFIDLDAEIEAAEGMPIARIFAHKGEEAFRRIETAVLARIAAAHSHGAVIALGGGTWAQTRNRAFVAARRTVFLDPPFELLEARVRQAGSTRPLAAKAERFRALYAERLPIYREAGVHCRLHGTESPQEAAEAVIAALTAAGEHRANGDEVEGEYL